MGTSHALKILIIEDNLAQQAYYAAMLEKHALLLCATSVDQGDELFSLHWDVALIIVDGRVPSYPNGNTMDEGHTTADFVRKARRMKFQGHIIAASSDPHLLKELCNAGCDLATGEKSNAPRMAITCLAELQQPEAQSGVQNVVPTREKA